MGKVNFHNKTGKDLNVVYYDDTMARNQHMETISKNKMQESKAGVRRGELIEVSIDGETLKSLTKCYTGDRELIIDLVREKPKKLELRWNRKIVFRNNSSKTISVKYTRADEGGKPLETIPRDTPGGVNSLYEVKAKDGLMIHVGNERIARSVGIEGMALVVSEEDGQVDFGWANRNDDGRVNFRNTIPQIITVSFTDNGRNYQVVVPASSEISVAQDLLLANNRLTVKIGNKEESILPDVNYRTLRIAATVNSVTLNWEDPV